MKVTSKEFRKAVHCVSNDPFKLADVMLRPSQLLNPPFQLSTERKHGHSESFQDQDGTDWSTVLNAWMDACRAASEGQLAQCHASQSTLHAEFNLKFHASKGSLLVPALLSVCKSSHRIAAAANSLGDHEKLSQAALLLQESFSRTSNDRKDYKPGAPYDIEGSKKIGAMGIVNELFAIYFVLNTLRLCMNLIKPVEARGLHLHGTKSEMVKYRYYAGRLSLFGDDFESAESNLEFALNHCHKDAVGNIRRILRYLIPVKLFRGRLPSDQLLQRYNLVEFMDLCNAIRSGDLRQFNTSMDQHEHRFIRQGTYLLLERCKPLCYRNLLRRIEFVLETHIIPTKTIMAAFDWLGASVGFDEAECIVANLIATGVVRGYIHHNKRVVVVSKRDPFPKAALVKN